MTLCLFRRYYVPAGVSMDWLKSIVPIIQHANLSQTGSDLISAKTGIIMCQTEEPNRVRRGPLHRRAWTPTIHLVRGGQRRSVVRRHPRSHDNPLPRAVRMTFR
jgi:hypothetical protein